jgi:class I lanthipeptide synthase
VGAELLLDAARRLTPGASLSVQEALPNPHHAVIAGADGNRLLELVVPVTLEAAPRADRPVRPPVRPPVQPIEPISRRERVRSPGSEWLYVKLYLHRGLADDFIGGPLLERAEALVGEGIISSWFFVRYVDPGFHLRLRVTGDARRLEHEALPRVMAWAAQLLQRGLIDRFAFDSYEREVERYGGSIALPWLERAFAADSLAVARLLAARRRRQLATECADLAVATVDDLLAGLGLASSARTDWYRRHAGGREHGAEFRAHRARLRTLVGRLDAGDPAASTLVERILAERRTVCRQVAGALAELDAGGQLHGTFDDIARSLVHMHCNRLQEIGATHEPRVLELARRTHESLTAWPLVREE